MKALLQLLHYCHKTFYQTNSVWQFVIFYSSPILLRSDTVEQGRVLRIRILRREVSSRSRLRRQTAWRGGAFSRRLEDDVYGFGTWNSFGDQSENVGLLWRVCDVALRHPYRQKRNDSSRQPFIDNFTGIYFARVLCIFTIGASLHHSSIHSSPIVMVLFHLHCVCY
jgi:hypothetical protein